MVFLCEALCVLSLALAGMRARQHPEDYWPLVADEVDQVSIMHVTGSNISTWAYFVSRVQGMPTLIARERCGHDDFKIGRDLSSNRFWVYFTDEADGCHRFVWCSTWTEHWVKQDPYWASGRAWWGRALPLGLAQPLRREAEK